MALVWFANGIADFAQIAKEYSDMLAQGAQWKHLRPPPPREWLGLYKGHADVMAVVMQMLGSENPKGDVNAFRKALAEERKWHRTPLHERDRIARELVQNPEFMKSFKEGVELGMSVLDEQLKNINDHILDRESEEEKQFQRFMDRAEAQFFFSVTMGCWVHYGEQPQRLYRRARKGDIDAIEKLLRLDKSLVGDPHIAREFHDASKQASRGRFDVLCDALRKQPKSLSHKAVRIKLAGLISKFGKGFADELTIPEILKLFDAFAAAYRRKPGTKDHHFPERPDSVARAVYATRQQIFILPDPEKTHA